MSFSTPSLALDGRWMAPEVEVLESISQAERAEWDAVVKAGSAPVFYSHDFLSSYQAHPLQNYDQPLYLVVREQGVIVGLVPAYLQTRPDALGTLSKIGAEPPVLMSHVLHCYDSQVVAPSLTPTIVELICTVLAERARKLGAEWVAFTNVDATRPLIGMLASRGFRTAPMEPRFNLDLKKAESLEALAATMKLKHRREMIRHGNRAQEAGVTVGVESPVTGDLKDVIDLLRLTAGKFEATAYYPLEQFPAFLEQLGDAAMLVRIQEKGQLLAAGACLLDQSCFHMWAAGVRYDLTTYSPYIVLFREVLKAAFASGRPVAEGGRGNDSFKHRYGMKPVPLVACIARAEWLEESR